jgi:glucokinase
MNNSLQLPLFFPRQSELPEKGVTVLAGDVGGTKTNMALFRATRDSVDLIKEATYHSATFHSFIEIIQKFLSENKEALPDRICAGVAGPVVNGKVKITNLAEELDIADIRKEIGVEDVSLLNDLESTAYGLAALSKDDLITLHKGDPSVKGNIAVIAPGTGLGEGGLYWDGKAYHPFPTEGGHCDFCPRTDLDLEFLHYLQAKYGIASWERIVAGPGIHDTYLFLKELRKKEEPGWLSKAMGEEDPSAAISEAAIQRKDETCIEAMDMFVRYLARESSNLVLKMSATGGLFLGGGIPPKVAPLLQSENFLKNYFDCDRMQYLLESAPIHIITKDKTALLGAAYYGAYGELK